MATKTRYSIDSSSLIEAWRRRYPIENFISFWKRMEEAFDGCVIVTSREVFLEIKRKDDELHKWLKERNGECIKEIDHEVQTNVAAIMAAYPKLVDTRTGKSAADPFVIALAMTHTPKLMVITEEQKGGTVDRPKIPFVCEQAGIAVKCENLIGLIQAEKWKF